jgi:hypothetical protein
MVYNTFKRLFRTIPCRRGISVLPALSRFFISSRTISDANRQRYRRYPPLRDVRRGEYLLDKTEEPIAYLHGGYDGIFPLVEEALHGKAVGDSVDVKLTRMMLRRPGRRTGSRRRPGRVPGRRGSWHDV